MVVFYFVIDFDLQDQFDQKMIIVAGNSEHYVVFVFYFEIVDYDLPQIDLMLIIVFVNLEHYVVVVVVE